MVPTVRRILMALAAVAMPLRPQDGSRLVLTGSSTLAPAMAELGRRFQSLHPGLTVQVEAGGSSRGAADARSGKADIGMVSRALHPDEKALFAFTIARDGIALVVHRDNPVKALGREQVIGIFRGQIRSWKAVGGADAAIQVAARTPGHSSLELFSFYFGLSPQDLRSDRSAGDNAEALAAVLQDSRVITFVSVGAVERAIKQGKPLRALPVDGVEATAASLRSGEYPLARPLNLVTRAVPKGAARAFIEYLQSERGRALLESFDFVPYGR